MKTVIFLIWVEFLPGHASIALDPRCKVPTGQHVLSISPGHGLAPNATVTAEVNAFKYMNCGIFWLPLPSTYLLIYRFFLSYIAAVCGNRGASEPPQCFVTTLLTHPDQESGRGSHHHARWDHRHHRHHRSVPTQSGAQSR